MPDPLPLAAAQARRGRPGRPRKHPRPVLEPGHAAGHTTAEVRTESGDATRAGAPQAPALGPRLLSVARAAAYLSISVGATWNLLAAGHLRRVELPGSAGRDLRRTLVDVRDCDALVERSKAAHP